MPYGDEIKQGNIVENWLFDFANDNSGFIRLSFADAIDSGNFYHGVILNKPSIREGIDLAKSTAKSSNISITIPDFSYQGSPISEELFGGSNHYINQIVSVYSIVGSGSKIQIGSFRLTDISSSGDTIQLSLTSHRPWDFISFPQTKTTSNNIPVPVAYGNYTKNSATTFSSPLFESQLTNKTYRPIPYNKTDDAKTLYVDTKSTSTDGELAIYEKGLDVFVPIENANSSTVNTDGADHGQADVLQRRGFAVRADTYEQKSGTLTNPDNAIDTDTDSYASKSVDISGPANTTDTTVYDFKLQEISGKKSQHYTAIKDASDENVKLNEDLTNSETGVDITDASNLNTNNMIRIDSENMTIDSISSNTLTVDRGFNSKADSHSNEEAVYENNTLSVVALKYEVDITSIGGDLSGVKFFVYANGETWESAKFTSDFGPTTLYFNGVSGTDTIKVKIQMTADDTTTGGNLTAEFKIYDIYSVLQRVNEEPLDLLYTANDGLDKSYNGGSGTITEIHEAHRDLINRFAGVDDTDANIDGWTDLNTSKDWGIRWWQLEPIELKKALGQLQYEGGFIFRFKADGSPQYIHIPDSPTVDKTLTKEDISNVSVKPSPFSELLTKMDVNYERHPAENRHLTSVSSANSISRTNWNIQTKENIQKVDLDAYVSPTIPTTPSTNPNDDFYTYYDNIFGDIKMMVGCTIVNPAFYDLEVGDIVDFSNMYPEKPFGYNSGSWSGLKFMITSLNRTLGEMKIETREI